MESRHAVFVAGHGWHTGLIVPASEISGLLPFLNIRFGEVPFIEFGWGDAGFYQAEAVGASLVVQALFWPTDSVMHVAAVPRSPLRYFARSELVELGVSGGRLQGLLTFIADAFHRDHAGAEVSLGQGIYGESQFYRGTGRYSAFNTCNTWTAKGLQALGMDIDPETKQTAGSVMEYLRGACDGSRGGETAVRPSLGITCLWHGKRE